VTVTSGVGAKGASRLQLSGGKGLRPEGGVRLAGMLRQLTPNGLEELDLRCC
jgi:hypothetical protein